MNPRLRVVARMFWSALGLCSLAACFNAWAADITGFSVLRGQHFTQLPIAGMEPVLDAPGFRWRADVRGAGLGSLLEAFVQGPVGAEKALGLHGADAWVRDDFPEASARVAAYPDGPYRFRMRGASEGLRTVTLLLGTENRPRPAKFLEPDALLAVDGRSDLSLKWESSGEGVEPAFVQVEVFNFLGDVVYRSPDPGQPGALSGEATEIRVPRSTWRILPGGPAGLGLFQIQLTTYAGVTLDDVAYPGAVGFSGTYRTTAITAVVNDVPTCDEVEAFEVVRGRLWRQDSAATLEPLSTGSYVFRAEIRECQTDGLLRGRWISPGGVNATLLPWGNGVFGYEERHETAAELAARFPPGEYLGEIVGRQAGSRSVSLTVAAGELNPPRVMHWDALQAPDLSEPVTIEIEPDAGRRREDDLQLVVVDASGTVVYETAAWWLTETRVPGDAPTLTIPRGVLGWDRTYEGRLRWTRRDDTETAAWVGATGRGGIFVENRFPIGTRNPTVVDESFGILNEPELPDLPLGVAVDFGFVARSGIPPITWEVVGGNLPEGVRLDPESGDLLGFPNRAGSFSFELRAIDAGTNAVTGTFSVAVVGPPAPLRVTSTALPQGIGGLRYCGVVTAAGGVRPFRWHLGESSNRLPRGLELDGEAGLITGIPEEGGTFPLRLVVTDDAGQSGDVSLDLVIPPFEPTKRLRIAAYQRLDRRHVLRLEEAEPGSYLVEASQDLVTWTTVASTREAPVGDWVFADVGDGGRKFLRVRQGAIGPDSTSVEVHAVLDPSLEVHSRMSATNTNLVLTNAQGLVFTLSLPPGSLREPTEIRMRSVASVPDLPMSGGWLGAVSLEPEGLVLRKHGTLSIRFPGGVPQGATAFSAQGLGSDFHRVGHGSSGDTMVIPVRHFTLIGGGTETQRNAASSAGCSLESWVSDNVQLIAKLPSAEDHELLGLLFTTWFDVDRGVRSAMQKAINDDKQLLNARREFMAWIDLLNQTVADPRLKVAGADRLLVEMASRIKSGRVLLSRAFLSAFQEAEARCIKNKAVREAFRFRTEVDLAREAVADGLCELVFDWGQLEERLARLLRCEYAVRSTTISKGSNAYSAVRAWTSKRGELTWDPGLGYWIGGKSPLGLISWVYHDNSGTTTRTAGVERGGVEVHEVHIGWNPSHRQAADGSGCVQTETVLTLGELLFEFNARLDVDLWLVPKKGPPNNTHDDFWRGPFVIAMEPFQGESGYTLVDEWTWTAKGERFARWSKSTAQGKISVATTIDLYYAPGK